MHKMNVDDLPAVESILRGGAIKIGALPRLTLDPDPAAVDFNHTLHNDFTPSSAGIKKGEHKSAPRL
jgi:hypothetical protein